MPGVIFHNKHDAREYLASLARISTEKLETSIKFRSIEEKLTPMELRSELMSVAHTVGEKYLLVNGDVLTEQGQNMFLKILEDYENILVAFYSSAPLLPTIESRCQTGTEKKISFKSFSEDTGCASIAMFLFCGGSSETYTEVSGEEDVRKTVEDVYKTDFSDKRSLIRELGLAAEKGKSFFDAYRNWYRNLLTMMLVKTMMSDGQEERAELINEHLLRQRYPGYGRNDFFELIGGM